MLAPEEHFRAWFLLPQWQAAKDSRASGIWGICSAMPWALASSPLSSTLENSLENWDSQCHTRGQGESRHLTVISTLSVDCHPPTPAPQAPHTSPFTLNVIHSVAQHGQPVALCFHICLLPFQHKITTMIAKVPLCPSPRLFHQRLSPERWGAVLCVQPCPPGDWHGGRDSYSRRSHLRFADDTVAHRRSMTFPGPSGRKREE